MNLRNRFLSIVALNAAALLVCAISGAESSDPDDRAHPYATGEALDAIDDSFTTAVSDVSSAPEFCRVVYVAPDATAGWRAVCVLLDDESGPATVRDRAGNVVYEAHDPEMDCYFESGETICPLVIVALAE